MTTDRWIAIISLGITVAAAIVPLIGRYFRSQSRLRLRMLDQISKSDRVLLSYVFVGGMGLALAIPLIGLGLLLHEYGTDLSVIPEIFLRPVGAGLVGAGAGICFGVALDFRFYAGALGYPDELRRRLARRLE